MENERTLVKRRLALFIALTVVIAWIVFMLIPVTGQSYGSGLSIVFLTAAMFVPALSSILTRLATKEGFSNLYLRPHLKGNLRTYLLVYFGPTVLLFLSGALYFLLFPGGFDSSLDTLRQAAASGGVGLSAEMLLLVSILQIVVIGPIINIIPTLGEELGWRGYLLPKLRTLISDRAALLVTGAIWGAWHIPVIVMGHNYGTDYWGYPWLGVLAMIVFCMALGVIEGRVSIKLESAIPAAMIHSLINAGAGLPLYMVKAGYNPVLGPTVAGLIGGLPLIIVAVVMLVRTGGRPSPAEAAPPEQG